MTSPAEPDSLKGLISSLLQKVTNIESKLQDLTSSSLDIKSQLTTLESGVQRLSSSFCDLASRTDALASSTRELKDQQASIEGRVRALETKPQQSGHLCTGTQLESRLEALERTNLNAELILFGVNELPSEDPGSVATSIATALHVAVSPGEVVSSFRIPAKGDRPRPLVVKLSSNAVRNRWIDGKRARGALDGSEVAPSLAGSRIEVNERLPSSTRQIFGDARRAVKEGRLHHTWVRNGIIYVKRHPTTSPIRLRHREHLSDITAGAPRCAALQPAISCSTTALSAASGPPSGAAAPPAGASHPPHASRPVPLANSFSGLPPSASTGGRGTNRGTNRGAIPKRPSSRSD